MVFKRRSRFSVSRGTYKRRGYRSRRTYKKKNAFVRSPRRLTKTVVPGTVIADKTIIKVVRSDWVKLTTSGDTVTVATVMGNGFQSGINNFTHPSGIQNWGHFYGKYRVMSCKVDVYFSHVDTSSTTPIVGIYPTRWALGSNFAPVLTSADTLDQPNCKWAQLSLAGGMDRKKLSIYMTTRKMTGQSVNSEEDFEGTLQWDNSTGAFSVTNPNSTWWFNIFSFNTLDTGSASVVNCHITMTYYVRLEDRVRQAAFDYSP